MVCAADACRQSAPPGDLFGEIEVAIGPRYKLPEPPKILGNGAYGVVVEALDLETGCRVAVKRMRKIFDDIVDCKRILREISILNRMSHSSVVGLLDIVIAGDLETFEDVLLILELVDSDFKKLFQSHKYLNDVHVKTLMYNALLGLNYIHSAGVYHRNLKPADILVNLDCSVKICDFGLARSRQNGQHSEMQDPVFKEEFANTSAHDPAQQLTAHVAARWYRAPELILVQKNYSQAIDMWSMGSVFAEMLQTTQEDRPIPERFVLFPGQHSYPLSPTNGRRQLERDQLVMILRTIGTPDEDDLAALDAEAGGYVSMMMASLAKDNPLPTPDHALKRLEEKFQRELQSTEVRSPPITSKINPLAIDLLGKMLKFDPADRITAGEALAHEYFNDCTNADGLKFRRGPEVTAKQHITLPFDDGAIMEKPMLRYFFIREVSRFHGEVKVPPTLESEVKAMLGAGGA